MIMKNKLLFSALMCLMMISLVACNTNDPQQKQKVPFAQVDSGDEAALSLIMRESNELLKEVSPFDVRIIRTHEELQSICPSSVSVPNIDFDAQSLIFAHVMTPSISDEWLDVSLSHTEKEGSYNFIVRVKKCKECYDAIGNIYPYGLFAINPKSVKEINLEVKYIND